MSLYKNLIYNKFVYVALFAMLITVVSCKTQGKVSTELKPLELDCVYVEGELYQRAMKNFDRLETDIYYPENVFPRGRKCPNNPQNASPTLKRCSRKAPGCACPLFLK